MAPRRVRPAGYVLAVMVIALATPRSASSAGAVQLAASWPRSVLIRLGTELDPIRTSASNQLLEA